MSRQPAPRQASRIADACFFLRAGLGSIVVARPSLPWLPGQALLIQECFSCAER